MVCGGASSRAGTGDLVIAQAGFGGQLPLHAAVARILREEQKKKDRRTKLLLQGGIILASLAIVAFLILATFLGLNIGAVVLIHEGSTLIVVGNALRLLNFERGKEHHGIDHEDRPTA